MQNGGRDTLRIPRATILTLPVIVALVAAVAAAAAHAQDAYAAAGSHVDSVSFIRQDDSAAAVDSLIAGDIDMSYIPVSKSDAQRVRDAGHLIYEAHSARIYDVFVNPAEDHSVKFNPFAYREVRQALNYMLDRDYIVDSLLLTGGHPMYLGTPLHYPDYTHMSREAVGRLGAGYDPARAERMIEGALAPAGAVRTGGGWHYDGKPVTVTVLLRDDRPERLSVGEYLASALEGAGFRVDRAYVNSSEAYDTLYLTDPAGQGWHLYVEGWVIPDTYAAYRNLLPAVFYSSWAGYVPGYDAGFATYENATIDALARDLYRGQHGSAEERAGAVARINELGFSESLRVFLAAASDHYPVRSGTAGVVNVPVDGIANRYTARTAQPPDAATGLRIGTLGVDRNAWNPVTPSDAYGYHAWQLLEDVPFVVNPYTKRHSDFRNVIVSVETRGPHDRLEIPAGAVMWGDDDAWGSPGAADATSRVRIDLRLSNWHHGVPMDINDILYVIVFDLEHHGRAHMHEEIADADQYAWLQFAPHVVAVEVVDDDTVDVYLDRWNGDMDSIAQRASPWPSMPWEIYHAMDMAVHANAADWDCDVAASRSGNCLDMLDAGDAGIIRAYLDTARDPGSPDHVPDFLYRDKTSAYVAERYDAAISWIDEKGHMMISNGPLRLAEPVARDPATGGILNMTLTRSGDPAYPLGPGMLGSFIPHKIRAGAVEVGALAPVSGSADRYGVEIREAMDMAASDFNGYLEARGGGDWSLKLRHLDTGTDPGAAMSHLRALSRDGVGLVLGPSIDIITRETVDYADANGMLLLSCCSSVPSLATGGDSLFRLLPDQGRHAQEIVGLMLHPTADIRHVVPVAVDAPWSAELAGAAKAAFEDAGGTSSDVLLYEVDGIGVAVGDLAETVRRAVAEHGGVGGGVAVLYIGFGEGPEFLRAAAEHGDVLRQARWYGADQNTASPNISDDPDASAFAREVRLTVTQPAISPIQANAAVNQEIRERLAGAGIEPSPYSSYAYDTVWLMGLSVLYSQSADPADVKSEMRTTASVYVGASGSTMLNGNGDLDPSVGRYQSWQLSDENLWTAYSPDMDYRCR